MEDTSLEGVIVYNVARNDMNVLQAFNSSRQMRRGARIAHNCKDNCVGSLRLSISEVNISYRMDDTVKTHQLADIFEADASGSTDDCVGGHTA